VGTLPSAGYHNGSWTIKARYGWRTFTPPNQIGDPQWREASISVNFANLLLHPDVTNPVVLAWDPVDDQHGGIAALGVGEGAHRIDGQGGGVSVCDFRQRQSCGSGEGASGKVGVGEEFKVSSLAYMD
jgi:hypothetical protein